MVVSLYVLITAVLTGLLLSPAMSQETCGDRQCTADQFCFSGTTSLCIACNKSCNGCTGPGAKECRQCAVGFHLVQGACTACPVGQFGAQCSGACHCLDNTVCNHVTGHCTGKCAKGYIAPPACQQECEDGKFGLDCLEVCHCFNDSVCEKDNGNCPGDLCHPDWYSYGCSKRLPKLSKRPIVSVATCQYTTVVWQAWNSDDDFGDLPIAEYRLYFHLNGSDSGWQLVTTIQPITNQTTYSYNITTLQPEGYYLFRVDVHGSDDNKVVEKHSPGLVSDQLSHVPCATSTVPPPVTVPIVVGADVFEMLSMFNQPNNTLVITWSIDPRYRQYTWNLTLSYQLTGTGNCAPVTDANITTVSVDQTDTEFRAQPVSPWSKYRVEMTAQGLGLASAANDFIATTLITTELAPSGNVSAVTVTDRQARRVTLSWIDMPCAQRGGVLLRYDITVRHLNYTGITQTLKSNVTSVVVQFLDPFTAYVTTVRYVNRVGAGTYSPEFVFTTEQGVPAPVSILSLQATSTTVEVKVLPPDPVNGILLDYYILFSDTATFTLPQSFTFNVSLAGSPVISRLKPDTTYYFKVRGRTSAGYGSYGTATFTRTQQARPSPPSSLVQTSRNLTCVSVAWLAPTRNAFTIIGYTLTYINLNTGQGKPVTLAANVTSYSLCDLDPGSVYNMSISSRSGAGSGEVTSVLVATEHADPPVPPSPSLVTVNTTSALLQLEPAVLAPGLSSVYQLHVQHVSIGGRKRAAGVPGYVTAQFADSEIQERQLFLLGDGQEYGGYVNRRLEPGQQYYVYYAVLTTFYNLTKTSHSRMDTPITTLLPPTTTQPTLPTTEAVTVQPSPEDDNGVLIGVIIALILLIIIIVLIIIFVIWWRRRRNYHSGPSFLELDEEQKVKPATPKDDQDSEKYWNQTTTVRENRYIVVGRECLPDDQLIPVGGQSAQPGVAKVTFKQEFRALPKLFQQATTRQAEQYPDRNRFPHILPYDHSLVELSPDTSSRCPYINANHMSGYKRQRCYIAAQSPYNEATAIDFWRLIHQHRIKTVVLVANGVEDNIVKCTQFWPREGKATIGRFHLELQEESVYANFSVHEVTVRETREQYGRVVRMYDFNAWPEHSVPHDPIPFLDFRYKVRQYHGDEPGPMLVHCGTGVGRTGVFIAVDSLIEQYATEGQVSVYTFIRKMRKERPLMVRTVKQYEFVYSCLLEEFHAGDTMIEASSMKHKYRVWTSKNPKTGHSFLRDQYQLLHRLTEGPPRQQCVAGHLVENVKRNRYPDVVPSDDHRPALITPAKLSNTDYINAVFVDGYRKQNQFIVTQTPLHTTLVDFWRLIYDHGVSTVVMMHQYRHEDDTCAKYWPDQVTLKQWEPFFVESTAAFQEENVMIRNLKVVNMLQPHEEPRMVRQFQFNGWSRNSLVPASKTMLLDLMDLVVSYQDTSPNPDSPIVVHCEDGATRCGLFISLAVVCQRMEEEQEVDVYHAIRHIKRRRPQTIADYEQLRFCYRALWDYINLRMPGGTFTETMGQIKADMVDGAASLSLTSH